MMQNSKYTVLMSVYYKEKPEYLSLSRVPSENDEIERFMHRRCSVLHPTVMYGE